ncbi:MAG: hypothetical protein JKY95_14745 [Planctomycetaceae bacterium]|nr:hypothetical protein [Planctomycetaceae bacterium]
MGKWSAFLISLIPAGLAGYLCFLLVDIGLAIPDDKMGMMFWGPLGAGFLGCVMATLTPFGIAIFVRSSPKQSKNLADDNQDDNYDDESEDDLVGSDFESDDDLNASDFESNEFEDDSSSEFQTAELDSGDFDDEDFGDDLSSEFDVFADDDEDDSLA